MLNVHSIYAFVCVNVHTCGLHMTSNVLTGPLFLRSLLFMVISFGERSENLVPYLCGIFYYIIFSVGDSFTNKTF